MKKTNVTLEEIPTDSIPTEILEHIAKVDKEMKKPTLSPESEKEFDWTFEDHKNENSLAYMVPTIGDIRKLKQFTAKVEQQSFQRGLDHAKNK